MSFSKNIILQNYTVPTIALFLFFGVLSWFFVMWYESRRDGFDKERFLDLSFFMFVTAVLAFIGLRWQLNWTAIYKPNSLFLDVDKWLMLLFFSFFLPIIPLLLLAKKRSWSHFRLLDIYATATTQLGFFLSLGGFLIYNMLFLMPLILLLPALYLVFLRSRGHKFDSGIIFSIFIFFLTFYIAVFYERRGYLIFCVILATISIINLIVRKKQSYAKPFIRRIHTKSKTETA